MVGPLVLVQAVLGEEQPGKTWGSSFSIPTSGLSERGKGLRRERKRAQWTKPALAAASPSAPSDPAVNHAVGLERPPLAESGLLP